MAKNSLPSPLESALANAPTFGLPESFKQATPQQQASFTTGGVPFQPYFNAASSKYGVPVNVLMALAQQESSFNPTALGQPTKYGRAKGLMQYIDSTAAGMGINPYDPVQSIDAAAKQLKTRLDQGYTMQEAISAHFGGDDRKQWGPKTRAYGMEVLDKAQRFLDGTPASRPAQSSEQGAQPVQGAIPTATSPDLTALQERGSQIDSVLSQLNQYEPDRYRPLTQEEVAKLQQQGEQQVQQQAQQPVIQNPDVPALDYSDAKATQAEAKGIADQALAAVKDAGSLLTSGVNMAAKDVQELVGKIPYIGEPIVKAADRFDRWANGKGSEEIFKEWDKNTEKSLSPEMLQARKKAWVIEPGDDNGDGTKATGYSFGPAWSDPRAYASGILESLPEMAITMGGSGRLASMAYKRALAKGATREAAAKTAAKTAMFAGGILEGGLGGAQASRETREQILKMTPEQLKDSEALASLVDGGRSFEDARRELADNAASKAFVLAGVTTGMFGGMGDRALAKIITGNSGRLKSALTGAVGEGLFEEVPQSATQQMSQNYAMQDADPNTPLMKGVANQAAGGLAVGGLMGAGMGAAAPRAGQDAQTAADTQPTQEIAQVDPQAMDEAVAAAPTPSRDDTGLSADAGPLERAVRGTAQQPDAANGNFWAGEPGATIQMQAKGDPETAMVATVERYERDGGVTVRGEDGSPYTVSPEEVDITAIAEQPQAVDQQMQDAGTTEEVKAERAQVDEQQAQERQTAIEQALQEQGVDPNTGEILDSSPAVKEEAAPVQKALEDMEEGELRDRMRYLARQAKTNGGWDKRLTDERRKVERVLDAKVQAAKAPVTEEQHAAQPTDAVLGADGKPKWFSTAEKAAAHIEKKGLKGYAPQEVQPGRYEIRRINAEPATEVTAEDPAIRQHEVSQQAADMAPPVVKSTKKEATNPRINRVKKLVGEVGQTVSPSGEVGGLQPGARYTVDRIEKNGTTYLTNQDTGETATVSMPDLEVGKSRRVEWSKVDAQAVAETATAERPAQQTANTGDLTTNTGDLDANAGDLVPDAGNMVAEQKGDWREQAAAALELVPDDHPMKRKWAANVKNGLKSESDRAGVMQAIVAAQSEPARNPDDLSGDHRVKGAVGEPKGAPLAEVKKYLDTTTMPLDRVIERGDEYNSPWLMSDGAIVGTGGDHIDLSSTFGYDGYRDMSLGTNAIRAGFHKNSGGTKEKGDPDSFVSLQIFDDQKLTPEQYATVKSFVEATGAEILLGVDKSGNNLNNTDMDPVSLEELAKYASDLPAQEGVSGETVTAPVQAEASNEKFAGNKIFTADKVEAARARMRSKFGQLNSGIDPEMLVDGMTIAGAYIESGVRKFSDYAKAMVGDFGDGVKPYLLSFWEGARNYPGLDTEGMTSVAGSATEHAAMLKPADLQSDAVGEVKTKPAKRTRKTGQKGDITLTQDWGVDHVDGFGENTSGRETGSDLKDGFLKESRQYLNAVADALEDAGFTLPNNAKGKPVSSVNVNAGGDAVSGDVTLNMNGPAGVGIYINISGTSLRGAVPTTTSGISVMYRTTTPEDRLGTRSQNQWAPVDLSAKDLADMVMASVQKVVARKQQSATQAQRPAATDENGPRPTSGLDAMVAEFDAEVERNGTATELGEPGAPALERAPAEPVRAAAEVREAGGSPAAGSAADGRGDGRPGATGDDRARGLGDDAAELPVPARGAERAGRSRAERSSTASRDGDAAGRAVLPAAGVTSQDRPADLFTINAEEIGQGGDKTKFANNVAAIRVLKDLETTGRPVTAADQAALAKYVGWGGIQSAFERTDGSANKGWEKQVAELKALLTPEEYAAAAASTRNAHYTSPEIVTGMWKALARLGFAGGRVIEPSVGVGNFFGLMPQDARGASALHGVELDRITSGIATALYPDAKIARMGYQEYAIPDGYFDVAVGNPPFGSEKLYDANRKDLSGFSIHNYFFARSVDALRPGGVLAMVVTNRFLDGNSDKARQYIAERADLVGAIRLPNNAFAKNAGTEVTTDIIILQRRAPGQKPNGTGWMNVVDYTDKNGATVPLNEYFQANPDNMLGEFGAFGSMYRAGDSALVAREGQNTQQLLDAAISRLPAGIMQPAVQVKPETRETVQAENVRVGSMFISGDGRVMVRGEDELGERTGEAVEFRSAKAEERVKGMLRLRDNLSRLRQLQLSNTASEAAIEEARARLNKTYDSFVKSNGPINSQANKLLFRDDPTWPQISALEDSYDRGVSAAVAKTTGEEPRPQSAVKAAIFTKRTQQPYSPPTSAKTAKDALVASLAERGRVDMDMMVQLYGKTEEQIANELGDLLFSDPDAGWQTRDQYLSGNVKRKLARAEEAAKTSQAYARNVEALRAVQPKDIEAVDINVKPGASWIPADVMASFADHITEKTGSKAFFNPLNANWSFPKLEATSSATARFGTSRMSVGQIIEAASAQKAVQVFDEARDGTRTLNETETQLANDKVKAVKEEWDRWIWSDDARRARLSRFYNDLFNTDVSREYDGSHLTFPGKISDDIIKLRPHQGNAVWRIVQGGSTLADHVVGAGKTFTLVAAAMELRRLGLARKPMFVVPNHLVGQWAQDFIKLYPGANVLAATKRDFEKANRKRFFARIATGDWDAVIVAHSSFGKVGMKPETEAEFIQEEIADLTASIDAIEAAEGKKSRNVKQAAERRTKMQEKLKALLDTGNKDDSLYWDDLGIDALFLDEAHEFKNLAYSTGMRNVAGLGSSAGSQKATDLYMKTRVVRKATGGRNVVFATGTPISNTMAEMYTMQRYLDYDNLKASGLSHFDAWARMFGEVVTDWELSPSGQYKMNSRFSKFVNMPELMQRYTSFADVINRDDINRMLAAQGKRLPVPKVKGGKPQNVVVDRSQWQAQYIGEPIKDADGNDTDQFPEGSLVYRAENLPKKAEKGGDNMLKIMSDARKAALDMRLIDPDYPDNPDSKVNFAANNIKADYDRWQADRGTQLVFIDLSTPKGARADEAAQLRDLIQRAESNDPAVAEPAQAELDKISPDEIDALNSAFSVYDDLKQKLVERGIPADEIAFIHDAKTDLQKTDLFAKVRSGRVRVLFGSTAKMGAGMNVQDRLVALHHLDAPWRPSDLEQREGRIIRQGNKLYDRDPEGFEVGIYRYATKQTLDSRMWQTIEGKANFIEQVRKGNTSTREIEDVAGEAANAAEMKAASSGNPLILEEMSLRQRIRTLENERTAHDRDQFRIRDRIGMEQGNVRTINRQLDELRADDKLAQPAKFEVTIDGQTFDKRKDAGEAIMQQALQMEQTGEETRQIGSYGGFSLTLEKLFAETYALEVSGTGTYSTKVAMGDDPAGLAMRMTNSVRDLPAAIEKMEEALAQSKAAIPALQAQVKVWPKEEQLKEATARHAEVIEQLRPKKKTEAAEKPAADEPQLNDLPMSTIEVDGKRRPTTNSNGKPIHPTSEGIRNFWRWFGDSKVVDEQGRPLVVYHGSTEDFDEFQIPNGGAYFAEDPQVSANYSVDDSGSYHAIGEFYLKADRPFIADAAGASDVLDMIESEYDNGTDYTDPDDGEYMPLRDWVRSGYLFKLGRDVQNEVMESLEAEGFDAVRYQDASVAEGAKISWVVFDPVQIKSSANQGQFDGGDQNIFNDLAMDTAYSRLPEGNRIQLAARLRKLEQQKEQLTPEQYSEQLGELAGWLEERSQENAFKRAVAERQRGADLVLERLHRARRRGEIGEDAADIAIWALNRNPQLAEDLGFSISGKGGSRYDRAERVARLMTEAMRDTAPIHEILHHTERMMPPGVQKGIAQEYNKAWARAYKKATPEQREALDALRLSAFGNSAARDATMKAFQSGLLDYDQHYQLTNASEYWAVNAASIMSARHSASKQGWVARAREWMRGFIQKLRAVFGLPSTAAVIRGLDAVTKGDGSFLTTSMLATNPAADTPLRDLSGDYADMPKSPSGMDPAPEIPTEAQDNAMLRSWWDRFKNAPSDLTTDAMQKGLALIPFRPLVQEMARNMPAAAEYLRLKQSMDAMRNRWHAKTDEVAQNWLKYRKDNTSENVELMNLMHEATIAGVDPSEEYQSEVTNRDREALRFAAPGSDREKELLKRIMEDKKQREEWDKLNARYKALSPQARKVFQDVRDAYTSLADEYEKVLLANMEKAINVRIKKAEREHRYEQQRIQDEGLTGEERTEAMDAADKKLRIARTKTAWNRKARMTQLRQQFEMNRLQGPYFPLARFGNLFVTVRDAESGKVLSFSKFEKAAEQREFADLMRQNKDYKVSVGTLDDSGSMRKAVDPNFVADVEDILADLPNAETVKDEVWQRYLESLPDYSVRKNRIHRTGRAGFNADALRAFGNQMFHGSHQLARLAHSFDMEEALDATREEANVSKDPVRDGLVVNEMEKRHEFIMNPTGGPLVQKITQAAFIYALAASPKAALVNLSQTVIMGIPILAGYDGSAKGVTRAVNQLTRALADFTAGKGKAENSKRLTADERKAMQEAYDNGLIDRTQSHDLAGIGETGVEYSPARTKVMGWLAWGFHHTERLNREVTFLAAYRMARAKGLPHVGAVQKAGDLTWRTHFDYQNTSRPRIMHNDTMKALLVFRNFTINMLYRLFRDIHQAASGDTPEVRREAKIQLAGITGMMMLSAGITGTWGFGILMVLASAFMDDDKDPEAELKKNMVEALGPMMAGIVLDGVPGYATGTSLSDSIGMRDLWFRSPSTQLEGKDEADYWKAQLLGAAPSIADNIVRGYGLLKEGQTYRGIETMMPKAIKDPMKAFRYSTEGATNKRGDVIVEDIGTMDIIRQALGFVPAKIAEQYDINNAGYNLQQTILRKRQQLMDEWWKAEEKEDESKLEILEKDIEAYNDKYPEQEITPKTLRRSARTREDNAENATGGIRYNRKLRDRILEEQAPTIYR